MTKRRSKNITISEEEIQEIQEICKQLDLTFSQYVRKALRAYKQYNSGE